MAFFQLFHTINYEFNAKGDNSPIMETFVDLSTKIEISITDTDLSTLCSRYTIQGSELPEHISQTLYNTPEYAWTIFAVNNIGSIANDWPLSDKELINFVAAKYGNTNIYTIHHYEKLPEGVQMDEQFIINTYGQNFVNPVTNLDYETQVNESKREIWVVQPGYIVDFVNNYTKKLS